MELKYRETETLVRKEKAMNVWEINMQADAHSAFVWFLIWIAALLINFLPSFVAFAREHESRVLLLVLNIFFGWTGVGWIVLLIWAFAGKKE